MNRRDLFKKIFTKTIDFTVEKSEEAVQIFQDYTNPTEEGTDSLTDSHYLQQTELPIDISNEKSQPNSKNSSTGNMEFRPKGLVYPPGALKPDSKFTKQCTACGDCVYSCPYTAIVPVQDPKTGKNLPYMDLNSNACMMCEDWPCIQSCIPKALKPFKKGEKPNFGQAKGIFEHCINQHTGQKTCNACQETCPVEKTVKFRQNKPSFAKSCTGCGLCVRSCPTFPKAITII